MRTKQLFANEMQKFCFTVKAWALAQVPCGTLDRCCGQCGRLKHDCYDRYYSVAALRWSAWVVLRNDELFENCLWGTWKSWPWWQPTLSRTSLLPERLFSSVPALVPARLMETLIDVFSSEFGQRAVDNPWWMEQQLVVESLFGQSPPVNPPTGLSFAGLAA